MFSAYNMGKLYTDIFPTVVRHNGQKLNKDYGT